MKEHDLVVIGAGPGGYVAAIRAAQLGLDTAIVEKEPALGGTCLRIGCIPSKALLESSELYHEARHGMDAHGIALGEVGLDLKKMLKRKDGVVKALTGGIGSLIKKNKITRYEGHGRLGGGGKIVVDTADGETKLKAKHIVIATGSKVAPLRGVKFEGDRIGSSTEALSYDEVPEHLVVIGAGYPAATSATPRRSASTPSIVSCELTLWTAAWPSNRPRTAAIVVPNRNPITNRMPFVRGRSPRITTSTAVSTTKLRAASSA
jgi:dihydrolipoamide dehydrogenase